MARAPRIAKNNLGYKPRFTITNAIAGSLTRIERARGFLEAAKLSESWILGMQARALVLEAHHTTHIEGTQLTLEQSQKLLAGKRVAGANQEDARELLNYRDAFELVAGYLGSGDPITEGLIREIHRRLVRNVRGNSATPGSYRKVQNYVVNSRTGRTIYTPPPAQDVAPMMNELVRWVGKDVETNAVLVAGIAQFQLVHIHPFVDGNGRTARLLSTLCLYRSGYDFKQLFTISEYYDRDRAAYYRAIQGAREKKLDLTEWLEYFTDGLATQMREVQDLGTRVIRKDIVIARGRKLGLNDRALSLLEFLVGRGRGTIAECEERLQVNRRTLQRDLKLLTEKRLVREIGANPTDPTRYYEPVL